MFILRLSSFLLTRTISVFSRKGKMLRLVNIIWMSFCGWELAVSSVVLGVLCYITIIGIPFGIQHFKFAMSAWMPFGT